MQIDKSDHKAFLFNLLSLEETPQGIQRRTFEIDKLMIASSTARKLKEGADEMDNSVQFYEGKVEFEPEEWVLLKEWLNKKNRATLVESESLFELKEIFNQK